jgi:cysteine desulfurase
MYFDNSATTKIDERVVDAMIPFLKDRYGNPSSIYKSGQDIRREIDNAREIIANYINSEIQEIVFTSGGSESNNLAIKGTYEALKDKGQHIIISSIEHDSVLKTVQSLKGAEITYIKNDKFGNISLDDLEKSITDKTILVSIIYANSEIGTIQNIKEISKIVKEKGIIFHTDAMQAMKYLNMDVSELNVDLMTFGAHKINGPKGVGALYIKRETPIKPLISGGSQEYRIRGGTENVPGIIGFGKATEILKEERDKRYKKVKHLRDSFEKEILKIDNVNINSKADNRMPHLSNILFKNITSESMLIQLDNNNIAASAGSACSSLSIEPSHVLKALGMSDTDVKHSVRFSFGHENEEEEILKSINIIKDILKKYE